MRQKEREGCPEDVKLEPASDEDEVEQIIIGDLATLMHPDTNCQHEHVSRGVTRRTPAFKWDDKYVWGLTADMFLELILWIKEEPSNRGHARLDYVRIMQEAALNS